MEATKEESEASKKLRAERIKLLKQKVESQGLRDQVQISGEGMICLLYTSPSPRDLSTSRMPSSA